jgi:hypothetical protein
MSDFGWAAKAERFPGRKRTLPWANLPAILGAMTSLRRHLLIASGALSLAACQAEEKQPSTAPSQTTPAPKLSVTEPPLDREALLLAGLRAASAFALKESDRPAQLELDGKPFELRIRFGCSAGSSEDGNNGQWRFDEKSRVLRVTVQPDITEVTGLDGVLESGFEAVEGFWLDRPWMLRAGCPSPDRSATALRPMDATLPSGAAGKAIEPDQRSSLGIAQFYGAADTRTHRRNERGYQTTKTLPRDARPSEVGYDLVLAGRLKAIADGRVIVCEGTEPDRPPRCLISAQFDKVTLQLPTTGETLAEWTAS